MLHFLCRKISNLLFADVPSRGGKEESTKANSCIRPNEEAKGTNKAMRRWQERVSAEIMFLTFVSKNN